MSLVLIPYVEVLRCLYLVRYVANDVCVRYYCSPNATVADALAAYDQSYCGQSAYASRPLPHYLEKSVVNDDVSDDIQDVCYHLIKLYCDRTHPLHVLLDTTAITDNPLDYSLRFVHLCYCLFAVIYPFIHLPQLLYWYTHSYRSRHCMHGVAVLVCELIWLATSHILFSIYPCLHMWHWVR